MLRTLFCTALLVTAGSSLRADSLWTAPGSAERAMFSDRKASRIGDILTVVVLETAATQSSQSKKTNSSANVDAGVEQFLFPSSVSRFG